MRGLFILEMLIPIIAFIAVIASITIVIKDKIIARDNQQSEQWFGRYMDENKRCDSLQNEVWQLKRENDSLKIELKYYE
jgi:lipopolysaccharide export LptBFGC system permease protein LptF